MLKKVIILIILGLTFSSCQEIKDFGTLMGVTDAINRHKREREKN